MACDRQATVRGFDPSDGSGSVFFDDGSVAGFGPGVFAASGLRLLRRGQRVAVRRGRSGAITALTLATLPLPPDVDRQPDRERQESGGSRAEQRDV